MYSPYSLRTFLFIAFLYNTMRLNETNGIQLFIILLLLSQLDTPSNDSCDCNSLLGVDVHSRPFCLQTSSLALLYMAKSVSVFRARSDWLLKLGISCDTGLQTQWTRANGMVFRQFCSYGIAVCSE